MTPAYAGFIKSASPYGIQNHGLQRYLPIQESREFSPEEEEEIDRMKSRWFPKIFRSLSTPMPELLSSPGKTGIMSGALGAGAGAMAGAGLAQNNKGLGAGIGALIGAGLFGPLGYFSKRVANEDILETMRRLPPGARQRDLLSDPVIQSRLDRQAMTRNSSPTHNAALLALLMSRHR